MTRQSRLIGWGLCLWLVSVSLGAAPGEDRTAELAGRLRPFVECLSGRADQFCLLADVQLRVAGKPRRATVRIERIDDASSAFIAEHDEYAIELYRSADSTLLALPKHKRAYIGRGTVEEDDSLAPRGFTARAVSSRSLVHAYLAVLSSTDENVAALMLNQLLGLDRDDDGTWTSQQVDGLRVRFGSEHPTIDVLVGEVSVKLQRRDGQRVSRPTASSLTEAGWQVRELPRQEIERLVLRGLRRGLEVVAPSPALTQPARESRQVANGELRWSGDQRLVLLRGTPEQIGRAHGELLAEEIEQCGASVLGLAGLANTIRTGRWILDDLREACARLEPFIPDDHKAETDAIADAAGLSRDELRVSNVFPEMFHCSGFAVFGQATADGKLYHGRVLDYMTMIGLQDVAAVFVVAVDGKIPFANVGYAGFVGSVSGMNGEQVSLGEMGGRGEGQWDGVPMATLMRRAMEECRTLDEVRRLWADSPRTCEYYYVFADGKTPSAVGVGATPQRIEFIEAGAAHERLGEGITDAVVMSAGRRLETLRQRVIDQHGRIDVDAAMQLMTRPVTMNSNLHNVLFVPQDLTFYVSHADHQRPASERPYVRYDLASLLQQLQR